MILLLVSILLITGCSSETNSPTGNTVLEINKQVSSDSYLEVNGEAQPIPVEIKKIGENYVYDISTITVADHHLDIRIIDNGVVVYEYSNEKRGFSFSDLERSKTQDL